MDWCSPTHVLQGSTVFGIWLRRCDACIFSSYDSMSFCKDGSLGESPKMNEPFQAVVVRGTEMLVSPRAKPGCFPDPKLTSIVLVTEFALTWLCGYPMQATRINWVLLRQNFFTPSIGCSWRPPRTATVSGLGAQTEDPAGVAVVVLLSTRLKTRVLQGCLAKAAPTMTKRTTEGRYSITPWLLWSSLCFCLLL